MHPVRTLIASFLLAAALAASAQAGVQIRVGVRPDTLAHCERGNFAFALWNDGADTLRVRVYVSIMVGDTLEIGPRELRTRLAPHELRSRDIDFFVSPLLPAGSYSVRMRAIAADSSRSGSAAAFTVVPSRCTIPDSPTSMTILLDGLAAGTGLDNPTPAILGTWGALKRRYDSRER